MPSWDELSRTPPRPGAPMPRAAKPYEAPAWDDLSRTSPRQPDPSGGKTPEQPRGLFERLRDQASDAFMEYSPMAALGRALGTYDPTLSDPEERARIGPQAETAIRAERVAEASRATRAAIAQREAADPAWRADGSFLGNVARVATDFVGAAGGGAAGDPSTLLAPGGSVWAKMLAQGLIGSGVDAATQGVEMAQDVRDRYDPMQTAITGAGGAGVVGIAHGIGRLFGRGPHIQGESPDFRDWSDRPLDGFPAPDGPFYPRGPNDIDGGVLHPVQQAPITNPAQLLETRIAPPMVQAAEEIPPWAPVTRSAPVNLSDIEAQVADEWGRFMAQLPPPGAASANLPAIPRPASPGPRVAPPTGPAPSVVGNAAGNALGRMVDITEQTESGGRRFGKDGKLLESPAGARGEMQVMPGTQRDPGFGVVAARDDSPEELARVGRDYIGAMMRRYGDDPAKAWAAYNAGPGRVDAALKHGEDWLAHLPAETQAYVKKNMGQLGSAAPSSAPDPVARSDEFVSHADEALPEVQQPARAEEPLSPLIEPKREEATEAVTPPQQDIPALGEREGSWVVVDRESGKPVFETFEADTAKAINQDKYEVLTAGQWLGRHNEAVRNAGGVEPDMRPNLPAAHQRVSSPDAAQTGGGLNDPLPAPSHEVPTSTLTRLRPDEIQVDAKTMQFKEGGDEHGVTDRLRNVQKWEPAFANPLLVWERADGTRYVADGHQRLGLAKRLNEQGHDITLDAKVLREADGVSARDARVTAALKNMSEGSGTSLDAAKVIRDLGPEKFAEWQDRLPQSHAVVRDARDLAHLSDDAFGAVVNRVVEPEHAAAIGRLLADNPGAHSSMIDLLAKSEPANRAQAESLVRQGIAAGFDHGEQTDMFGTRALDTSLFKPKAEVLDAAKARLRKLKSVYGTAAREADTLEQAGSSIAREASQKESAANAQSIEIIDRLAYRPGPVSDALTAAARALSGGAKRADAVEQFVSAVRGIDLASAARESGSAGGPRDQLGEGGSARHAGAEDGGDADQALSLFGDRPARPANRARAGNDNMPDRPVFPGPGASDREIARYHLADEKYQLAKAARAEERGKAARAESYRRAAKLARHAARSRDPELAGELSIGERARHHREEADHHQKKMDERASRGDAEGVERHRLFRDDARDKASRLAQLALEAPPGERPSRQSRVSYGGVPTEEGVKSLRGELQGIAETHQNRHYRDLAARLDKLVGDDATLEHGVTGLHNKRNLGEADIAENRAFVRNEGDSETTLHEGLHLAVMSRYGREFDQLHPSDHAAKPALEMLDLYNEAKARWEKHGITNRLSARFSEGASQQEYAFTSADEFISQAMTNKATQDFLQRGGLWDRFVDGVRKLLGFEPKFKPMLDRVLRAGADLLDAAQFDPERYDAKFDPRVTKGFGPDAARSAREERPARPGKSDGLFDALFDKDGLKRDAAKVREIVGNPVQSLKAALKTMDRACSATIYSIDGALRTLSRHYKAPTIRELADMFQARAGAADGTGRTYDEAIKRGRGRFQSRLDEALAPLVGDDAALGRVRDLLTNPTASVRASAAERKAAGSIRDLLKDVHTYRREAGDDIGEVTTGYFPRVLDSLAVANDRSGFVTAATELYRKLGVKDPDKAANDWLLRVMDTHQGIEGGFEFVQASGKPSSAKAREFGTEADTLLRDYYQKDPHLLLTDYINGSVRRAEQTRRFGMKGAEGSAERAQWEADHGGKSQWDVMRDKIAAELRANGDDAHGVLDRVLSLRDTAMGRLKPVDVKVSSTVANIHAWNQLSTLERVTLSSLGDMAMGFVRGGSARAGINHVATQLAEIGNSIAGRDSTDARRYAEAIGVVGSRLASDLIQSRMDVPGAVTASSALMEKFYRKTGLTAWTNAGRTAAADTASTFLDTLAGDMASRSARTRQRAAFYLKELGVSDPDAFAERLRKGRPGEAELAQDRGFAAEYATAAIRFADQSVLMPTRAQKPAWASHPIGSLVFALQSFNAAFTQNVLKRVGRLSVEAAKQHDLKYMAPAAGLLALAGVTALQDYLRGAIFGASKEQQEAEGVDYALRIADRMGMTGLFSPFLNALKGLKYSRSMSQSLQGAVIGRAADALDAGAGLVVNNKPSTNSAERKAAAALYDIAINPAINAIGAGRVRGVGGSAVIFGSGNREGGLLPADRDWFVDEVAGPKGKK